MFQHIEVIFFCRVYAYQEGGNGRTKLCRAAPLALPFSRTTELTPRTHICHLIKITTDWQDRPATEPLLLFSSRRYIPPAEREFGTVPPLDAV